MAETPNTAGLELFHIKVKILIKNYCIIRFDMI